MKEFIPISKAHKTPKRSLTNRKPLILLSKDSSNAMMGDVVIAMLPLLVMACYFYGTRPLMVALWSVAACKLADSVCCLIARHKLMLGDLSPMVTGLVIAMLLPASVPYYIPVAAGLFAILVVKQPFGGTGNNLFNPAAAGFAFAAVCWPQTIFRYPQPMERMEAAGPVTVRLLEGSAYTLKLGGIPSIDWQELLLGNFAGPMGATHILVMATCLIFLLARKTADWRIPLGFISVAAVFSFFFARIPTSPLNSIYFELFSGSVIFTAIYMVTDPVTAPKTGWGRFVYGGLAGLLTMLFRYYGGFEQGGMSAVLVCNALSFSLDRCFISAKESVRRVYGELVNAKK